MIARVIAALLAGAAPAGLHAQEVAAPPTPPPTPKPAPTDRPPAVQFLGPDGKPLPPEVQAQLAERFRKGEMPIRGAAGAPDGDVVVRAQRPRGAVAGDIPPERVLNAGDLRAYGANSVEELIQALGREVASGRGRDDDGPVVLLNGKRVSSFAEIARLPTEAIERMEVLPEEVALRYGYRADQKVVNVVAYERFSSRVGQATAALPTDGGRDTLGGGANYLRIQGSTRLALDAQYSRAGKLLESERDVRQPGGEAGLGGFRTLLPSTERLAVNGSVARTILGDVSATLNGRFEANANEALLGSGLGLGPDGALARDVDTRSTRIGTTLGGAAGKWQWTVTGTWDRMRTDTATDARGGGARDVARAVSAVAGADLLLAGPVIELPAGAASASVRGGFDLRDFDARSLVGGASLPTELARERGSAQASLDLPVARVGSAALPWLGTLSANANLRVERLSDAGTLTTFGYGLSWAPTPAINLVASVTEEQGAPTVEQLGAPLIVTPNLRTFDFVRGETVDVTRVDGGNRGLRPDDRRVVSLGLTAKPLARTDLTLTLDYLDTQIDDPIAGFPVLTPAVAAAFPDRVTRDGEGRLLRIDATPLNFARSEQRQLRWGLNLVRPLGPIPPGTSPSSVRYLPSMADLNRPLPGGAQFARVERIEPGSPGYRRFENLSSRLTLGLQHLWRLEDEVLLRPGAPVLDLLDGGALDAGGGRPRHEVELQAGAFRRGLGARMVANWRSGTTVRGSGPSGDLDFSSYATVNLNLFADLATYLRGGRVPDWAKGLRLSLGVTNLLDARPEVRDMTGATPVNYQPAYLSPLGRTVSLAARKVF